MRLQRSQKRDRVLQFLPKNDLLLFSSPMIHIRAIQTRFELGKSQVACYDVFVDDVMTGYKPMSEFVAFKVVQM